jgi:hypothetical protein
LKREFSLFPFFAITSWIVDLQVDLFVAFVIILFCCFSDNNAELMYASGDATAFDGKVP